ncbi:cis-3-alkyl-4-alkyloxetan-2-one decarboxylase isoform X2 [Vitis riparia]|uniref:cis-3-alkyl-4-alkyloxetan-2-one decarboxylase isoform X2 n=1 Tax=Vitis riparia TaxID=96939 RepID=UPI00155A5EB6|nr:cis-3-alkyl-4-alkyloxetan-2-one decarboxylase isoform X2 [Vitis riparia]
MASSFPSPLLNLPLSSSSLSNSTAVGAITTSVCWRSGGRRSRGRTVIANATEKEEEGKDSPAFNPFGFVTDNPSSRSAIQLPESPAEDGNVGQMLYMSDAGFHCFAPDWIGFGFSEKPYSGYGFDYTEKEFHDEFDKLLDVLEVKSPFLLVVQGFLVGSFGLTWALKNPSRISKLAILNSPLTASSPVPGLFQQLRIPLYGEFTCQNAVMAERFIEAGSAYVLKLEKADVYRLPYLSSSGPGFALLEAARKANFKDIASQVAVGFASGRWDKPILVAWGISDKYLPQSVAEEFQKGNPDYIKLKLIEGAGHMPQEDWPEKVVDALRAFF